MTSAQGWARLYYNVSLIECESKEILDELLSILDIQRFVIARISDRSIIVDGAQKSQVARALARRGHPFRITDLVSQPPLQD